MGRAGLNPAQREYLATIRSVERTRSMRNILTSLAQAAAYNRQITAAALVGIGATAAGAAAIAKKHLNWDLPNLRTVGISTFALAGVATGTSLVEALRAPDATSLGYDIPDSEGPSIEGVSLLGDDPFAARRSRRLNR